MTTYTFYANVVSGDIDTLNNWRANYESLELDLKSDGGIEEWIEDGSLVAIELVSDDNCFQTNRVFPNWFGDTKEGEAYMSEWACHAVDEDGVSHEIVWMFPAEKGKEPEDDSLWPWDNESFITKIE